MKKILSTALVVAGLAAGTLALTAFRHHGDLAFGHHPDPARMERMITNRVEDMLDSVKASDAQRQQILAIKDKVVADGKALHAQHADAHQQLLALWCSDSPDRGQMHALVDGRADQMKAFADEVADAVLQVHAILTPEQRAIVAKHLQRNMGE